MAKNDHNYIKRGEIYILEKNLNFRLRKFFPTSKNFDNFFLNFQKRF